MQIDVGFGDVVTPAATVVEFPVLLDFPAPRLRAYPRETVVAEKLEAMVKLGQANSRMKDFYDLVILSQTFPFDGDVLVRAIGATFARRGTPLPAGLPVALTPEFTENRAKNTQWAAFLRKSGGSNIGELSSAARAVAKFVKEPLELDATASPSSFSKKWPRGGPWK